MKQTRTATGAETEGAVLYFTKRLRIPRKAIQSIEPARDGSGDGVLITDRGTTRVCEPYEECLAAFLGSGGKEVR